MDLLNQTLNSFSTQISDLEVSLNFDIFESNVINISILAGGLFYLLSGALSESLAERQQKILGAIQESEEKLQEATTRLSEGETQLAQAQMVIDSIQKGNQRLLELTCEKVEDKRMTVLVSEITAVQIYEKTSSGTSKRPGFSLQN